jgi:diaminohydroxyphosphoribosylaminopyrimidine deaminase/5-amino-6-(5-phosphoribosylamino)uracil reductase
MNPDPAHMRLALRLAMRAYGCTSPNPLVGAVLVRNGRVIGKGWHHRAGKPHAEIEALRDAERRGETVRGATIYVTLEPCCSHGRTPPCTDALIRAGVERVVVAATDPNPKHAGRGFEILRAAGIPVEHGVMAAESNRMNEAFNHWIVHRTPFVTAKIAMTLDGKIATASGESKWITGPESRAHAHRLRLGADATLVGLGTVLADDPSLTVRSQPGLRLPKDFPAKRRVVLDSKARTPLDSKLVTDEFRANTIVVTSEEAPKRRVAALRERVTVLQLPARERRIDLSRLMVELGALNISSVLVEGGGEVLGAFFEQGLVHRTAFFYAPMILGGRESKKAVAGAGFRSLAEAPSLADIESRRFGDDLFVTARVVNNSKV